MPRQAVRSALGRAAAAAHTTTPPTRGLPLSTPTPTTFFPPSAPAPAPASRFSTSSGGNGSSNDSSDGPSSSRRNATVQKLVNITRTPNRERRVLDELPGFAPPTTNSSDRASGAGPRRDGGTGGVDARSLRVALSGDPGAAPAAGRVLNVRSLRGGLRGAFRGGLRDISPFGRGGGVGAGAGAGRFGRGGGRFGGRPGGDGAARGRGSFRGRSSRGGISATLKTAKAAKEDKDVPQGKVVWSEEEQAVLDRLDKGEVVEFEPSVTVDSLAGYGPAMATDAPTGQVETAMRVMRLMTGGMAFNAESGVTTDLKIVRKRYMAKMPIFVHNKGEKAWIESANPRLRIAEPNAATKKAIIDHAILGHYEAQGFAEIKDVKATMANYLDRTFTYMGADAQRFADKVLSLMPAEGAKKPAAAQARK